MAAQLISFIRGDEAQSMVEYTLLIAFMTFAGAALFLSASESILGIWNTADNRLSTARQAAS